MAYIMDTILGFSLLLHDRNLDCALKVTLLCMALMYMNCHWSIENPLSSLVGSLHMHIDLSYMCVCLLESQLLKSSLSFSACKIPSTAIDLCPA